MKTITWDNKVFNSSQILKAISDNDVCITLSEGVNIESKASLIDALKHYGHDEISLSKYDSHNFWITTNDGHDEGIDYPEELELILEKIDGE